MTKQEMLGYLDSYRPDHDGFRTIARELVSRLPDDMPKADVQTSPEQWYQLGLCQRVWIGNHRHGAYHEYHCVRTGNANGEGLACQCGGWVK